MDSKKYPLKHILGMITFTVVLFWGLEHYTLLLSGLAKLFTILAPFILGASLAFILNILLRSLESLWDKICDGRDLNRIRFFSSFQRPCCLILSLVIVVGAIFIVLFMVLPELGKTIMMMADSLPSFLRSIETWWKDSSFVTNPAYSEYLTFQTDWNKLIENAADFLSEGGKFFFNTTMHVTTSIFNAVFNLVLGLVFSIYLLLQKEQLTRQCKKLFYAYLPERQVKKLFKTASLSQQIFSNFAVGQLTEAFIIGFLCFLGMSIFRMPYALMVSVLIGSTALIPVFGAFIGTAVGAFLILVIDPVKAFWFIVFIIVLQQLESNLIYPKVVGQSIGLPGIWVLASVTVGGNLFGILGMLLGVPLCSVLYALLRQNVTLRLTKRNITVS